MTTDDWNRLCRNIYEKKCILFIGPEFPLYDRSSEADTTFSKILSLQLIEELNQFERLPLFVKNHLENRELSQLCCDYINYNGVDKKIARNELEGVLEEYLPDKETAIESETFVRLAGLPFTFIVNTNYSDFFVNQLRGLGKDPRTAYYNFKGNKIDLVASPDEGDLGTELHPFVFNLFGSVNDPSSLILSENDLIQFVINIISKNPGLPANVKSELANQEKCFLFLGFGFLTKSWYFRILLQALESNNKGRMSYALDFINTIKYDEDPTVLFFRDELKVSLCYFDQSDFINSLVNNYNAYIEKKKLTGTDKIINENSPRVFISYKSEDIEVVNKICQYLKKEGLNIWLDRERLQGKWADAIAKEIDNCDAYVLIQSQQLKSSPVNYVHVEIKKALERSKYYANSADFIFPTYIDNSSSVITEYRDLLDINSYDLTLEQKIDQLVKDIKRSYERNKRNRAA